MIKTTTNTVLDYSYVSKRMIDIDSRTFKAISDFTNCLHNLCLEYNRNAVVYNIMSSLELLIVLMESQFEGLKNIHYIRLCACDGKTYNIKVSDVTWKVDSNVRRHILELIRLSAEEVFGCYIERNIMISEILDKLRLYDESWE